MGGGETSVKSQTWNGLKGAKSEVGYSEVREYIVEVSAWKNMLNESVGVAYELGWRVRASLTQTVSGFHYSSLGNLVKLKELDCCQNGKLHILKYLRWCSLSWGRPYFQSNRKEQQLNLVESDKLGWDLLFS